MENRPHVYGLLALSGVIGALSAWWYSPMIHDLPKGHHAWAMADYYAMALQFAEHSLNIFQPRTFSLVTDESGLTASDLPLPAWICGVLMRITGIEAPWLFRLLTLFASLAGSVFLYKSLTVRGVAPTPSVLLAVIFWLLPGLAYYHAGFLPSIWALSFFMAGLWALQHDIQGNTRFWPWAIGLFVLAALVRKPFILPLLALGVWHLIWGHDRRKTWMGIAGLVVFALWQVYDGYLYATHGSIFLRHFMWPKAGVSLGEAISAVGEKWGLVWFSPAHLVLFVVGFLGWWFKGKPGVERWHFAGVLLFGVVYFVLMLRQFTDHEYYVIDSFYPVVAVGMVYGAPNFPRLRWGNLALLLCALVAGWWSWRTLTWLRNITPNMLAEKTNQAYRDSRPLLQQLQLDVAARVLVFEGFSTNIPLMGMGRRGYCLLSSAVADQEKLLAKKPEYAVCLDTNFIAEVVQDNPKIVQQLAFLGRNNDIWVFQPGNYPGQTLSALLAKTSRHLVDTSGRSSDEYLFTHSLPLSAGVEKVLFEGGLELPEGGNLKATVALFSQGKVLQVLERPLVTGSNRVGNYTVGDINLPVSTADEMRVYVWNPDKKPVLYDHFSIQLLELKAATSLTNTSPAQ